MHVQLRLRKQQGRAGADQLADGCVRGLLTLANQAWGSLAAMVVSINLDWHLLVEATELQTSWVPALHEECLHHRPQELIREIMDDIAS